MVKLLVIADDFTGALDTGVQFAKQGICTQVFATHYIENADIKPETEVLVVNTESRPMEAQEAYQVVHIIANWAVLHGIEIIFKKTDSALRGNIGMELQAVADISPEQPLYFLPGYPEMNRITLNGTQYISGDLLEDSVFGKDPFEPVKKSYIPDIIREESGVPVICIGTTENASSISSFHSEIVVCDMISMEDLDYRLDNLISQGLLKKIAGCAALAERLVNKISFHRKEQKSYKKTDSLYVACGSLNQITKKQVEYAERHGGFCVRHLTMEQKLIPSYFETKEGKQFLEEMVELCKKNRKVIVDTFDQNEDLQQFLSKKNIKQEEVRSRISEIHGRIVKGILEYKIDTTILMTGGDTLMGYMKLAHCTQLEPVCEIEPGVVVSFLEKNGHKQQVISKSGGFGTKDILERIANKIITKEKEISI